MRKVILKVCFTVIVGAFVLSLTQEAKAIPTFARKYRTSCNTCHVAAPKLTGFGESFRLNGYQIPEGDTAYIKEEPVSLGAPAWARVWPEAVWPGAIPGPVPLSVRIMSDFKVNPASSAASTEFDFPHEVEVMMSGLLGENVPFFAEIEFEGGATETEAWLGFYDLFSSVLPQRSLNLKVGNLMWNPLPMANDHLRIGKEHYLYENWRLPSASDNQFRLRDAREGLELNGIVASRFYYSAGVVEGDNAHDKDGFVTLRYKWGGIPFDRSAPTEEATEEAIGGKAKGFWVDNALELAGFGYFGSTEVTGDQKDDFHRVGIGLRGTFENLDVAAGFVWGENDDPYGSNSTEGIDSSALFVDVSYVFFPWLIGQVKYETLDIGIPSDYAAASIIDMDRARLVPGIIFQIRPNIKLVAEGLLYDKYDEGGGDPDSFAARLDVSY